MGIVIFLMRWTKNLYPQQLVSSLLYHIKVLASPIKVEKFFIGDAMCCYKGNICATSLSICCIVAHASYVPSYTFGHIVGAIENLFKIN